MLVDGHTMEASAPTMEPMEEVVDEEGEGTGEARRRGSSSNV